MSFTLLLRGEVWDNADSMTAASIPSTTIVIDAELAAAVRNRELGGKVARLIGLALLEGPLRRANRTLKKYSRGKGRR